MEKEIYEMTPLSQDSLHRKNIEVRALLGDRFLINFAGMSDSEPCKKYIKVIRSRNHVMRDEVSCRVVNHWESKGLIECERNNESGWRRFNLIESVWLRIVQRLREIGLPLTKIGKIKPFYFEDNEQSISMADFYITLARLVKQPVFFVVLLNDEQAELLDFRELHAAMSLHLLGNYISININDILNQICTPKVKPKYPLMRTVSPNLCDALDILEDEDYDTATIHKKDKNIQKVELNKHCDNKMSDHAILEDYDDVDLVKKKRKGQVISKKRTVIKTLEE
jgi:DNA-binding transcriptional MerR regulator